jgi:hypothetical protein
MRLGGPALGVAFALCSVLAGSMNGQSFPRLQEENLNGQQVVLPDAAAGKVAVLIFGFTRSSQTSTSSWAKRVQADYGKTASIAWYQLPVLEEAPRLIRGMIVSGMKKGVVADIHANFVPVMHDEAELKKLVGYKEADDAYIVVLDRSAKVAWQTHAASADAGYSELQAKVAALLK